MGEGGGGGMRERSGWQNLVYKGGVRARENKILRVRGRKREVTYFVSLQAARVTRSCMRLKKAATEVRARPYSYNDTPQLDLDSLVTFTSSLNMSVRVVLSSTFCIVRGRWRGVLIMGFRKHQ